MKVYICLFGLILSLVTLFYSIDINRLTHSFEFVSLEWILVSFFTSIIAVVFSSAKFYFFVQANGMYVSLRKCMEAVMAAVVLNVILPAKGGDLVKGYYLDNYNYSKFLGVTTIERIFDILTLSVLSLIGSLLIGSQLYFIISFSLIVFCLLIFFIGPFTIRKLKLSPVKKNKFLHAFHCIHKKPIKVLSALACSAGVWCSSISIMITNLKSVGLDVNLLKVFSVWPLALFVGILPLSVSGIGTRDTAFIYIWNFQEINATDSTYLVLSSFIYTAIVYWALSLISILVLGSKGVLKIKSEIQERR